MLFLVVCPRTVCDHAIAEPPTDGYFIGNVGLQYHLVTGSLVHTFDLGVENITDSEYRDHLSRVRVIMPEAGRSLTLQARNAFKNAFSR